MNTHIANTLVESWSNWFFLSSNPPPPHIINNRLVKFDSLSRVCVGSWRLSTGFLSFKSKTNSNVSCGCSSNNSSNGLEAEILEFMKKSRNPHAFPSKKDLLNAGRKDLVLAILKEGGYLAYGWDNNNNNNSNDNDFDSKFIMSNDDNRVVVDTCLIGEDEKEEEEEEKEKEEAFVVSNTSSYSASSSGRSMETAVENDSGIDGILSRLRNERSKSFALDLAKRRINGHKKNSAANSTRQGKSSKDVATWSIPKANAKFEAANSSLAETKKGTQKFSGGEILKTIEGGGEPVNGRLQRLNSEISSILSPLRSNSQEIDSLKENENLTYMYPTVSDSWEFQENTIMNASDKLRSLRAKTAVLEGKLTLATADLRKKIDERQKRIDCARAALNLLRTACIFWTSPADEVFLTGSFDGWSTQRKMEKSGAGIFSLTLQLYPGRHEIKFIVDGEWRIDPLRPVVNNDGHKNNLLVIS